jgi:hypothetical protein
MTAKHLLFLVALNALLHCCKGQVTLVDAFADHLTACWTDEKSLRTLEGCEMSVAVTVADLMTVAVVEPQQVCKLP